MSLSFEVLGDCGRDNALLVTVNGGQSIARLLFDCGEGCLSQVPYGTMQEIDHLFFSHLHMDHVGGFDTFFRGNFGRTTRENRIWGPPQTAAILQHRFQGFLWNLVSEQHATWRVHELSADRVATHRFELHETFTCDHAEGETPRGAAFLAGPGYSVEAYLMDHGAPSVAYVVRESPRRNVDPAKLAQHGLRPGSWLQKVRGAPAGEQEMVPVAGVERSVRALQELLVVETPGDSIAYLTDFLLDEAAEERLAAVLHRVGAIVCESQYRTADLALAVRNRHMTSVQAAKLAKRGEAGRLVLFHLSDRYRPTEWMEMLEDARSIFLATSFPEHWRIDP